MQIYKNSFLTRYKSRSVEDTEQFNHLVGGREAVPLRL